MILGKSIRTAVVLTLFVVGVLVSQGFGQGCCLGDIYTDSAFKADMLEGAGATNIVILSSTCTEKSASGTIAGGTMTFVQTLSVIETVNLQQTVVVTRGDTVVYSSIDTIPSFCEIAVEKKPLAVSGIGNLSVRPNPFQTEVNLSFNNEIGNAQLQVFDAKGVLVYEVNNIRTSQVAWRPASLKQGMYFARVRVAGKVYVNRIIRVK